MPHTIFRKAKAAARLIKEMDYEVSLICRSMENGHSATLRARRMKRHVYIERGFQLLDHEGADVSLDLEEFPTVVDGGDLPVAKLVKLCMVPNEALDTLADSILTPRVITPDEQHQALEKARQGRRERAEKEMAHLRRVEAWLARNCPDYAEMAKPEKMKIRKQACLEIYGATA